MLNRIRFRIRFKNKKHTRSEHNPVGIITARSSGEVNNTDNNMDIDITTDISKADDVKTPAKYPTKRRKKKRATSNKRKKTITPIKEQSVICNQDDNDNDITDAEIVEQPQKIRKGMGIAGCMAGKTKKAIALVEQHGLTPREALILATGKPNISHAAVSSFKAKVAKHSLQTPQMQRMAASVVKDVLKGSTRSFETEKVINGQKVNVTETLAPSYTNQLAAAAMVYDRLEPIVRQNLNINANLKDFMPVNLDDYR